jgi:hypothetical protein
MISQHLNAWTMVRTRNILYLKLRFSGIRVVLKKKILGRTYRKVSPDTTRDAQKTTPPTIILLLRICCRSNVFTEPLPSNERRDTHTLTGGRFEVRRWDGLKCHDIRGGLISFWLYKENNKLRDWKNVFTLHIPPELHTLMTSMF